jgi:hypothetical protein
VAYAHANVASFELLLSRGLNKNERAFVGRKANTRLGERPLKDQCRNVLFPDALLPSPNCV